MSDNLCGPSAPTKGLINQLDRDNSLHQTHMGTARGPANQNFRTASGAAQNGGSDADLNQFLNGPGPPPGALMPFPATGPHYQAHHQNHGQGNILPQQNIHGALPGVSGHVSTNWVNDFRNMQLNNNNPQHTQRSMPISEPNQARQLYTPSMPNYTTQFSGPHHVGPFFNGPQVQPGMQQTSIPQGPTMASSNQKALDDVFAELFANADNEAQAVEAEAMTVDDKTKGDADEAKLRYEQDFYEEMDQWMAVNGRSAEKEDQVNQQFSADAFSEHRELHYPLGMSEKPIEPETEHAHKQADDEKLRKAAQDIMQTLSTNKSEKFQNSSFIHLMNRIYEKEVVLQGNDLFDTTTGTVLGNTTDTAEAQDLKGKGKATEEVIIDNQHAA